jgi:hypothetical protein
MNALRTTIICASFVFAACSQQGDLASPTGEAVTEAPQVYNFQQHSDPASKPTDTFHRDRMIPEALDACGNTCMKGWEQAYNFCMGDHPNATSQQCEVIAHDRVAACMDETCVAAPEDGGRLGECATTCDDEVRLAIDECMSLNGNPWFCEEEANAIHRTCYDGECRDEDSHATAAAHRWNIQVESEQSEPKVPAATCEDLCEAYDVKIYLQCLDAHPERPDMCREGVGEAYRRCVTTHCPAN